MHKLFHLSGFLVAIYYKIKAWNRKRLALRRLKKIESQSSQTIVKVNCAILDFENKFNYYSDTFTRKLNHFNHWQIYAYTNHINQTENEYDKVILQLDSTIQNLFYSKDHISTIGNQTQNELKNIFGNSIDSNTQHKNKIIQESIDKEMLHDIFDAPPSYIRSNINKLCDDIHQLSESEIEQQKMINNILEKLHNHYYYKKKYKNHPHIPQYIYTVN